jgi:hypothetical protein
MKHRNKIQVYAVSVQPLPKPYRQICKQRASLLGSVLCIHMQ